MTQTKTMPKKKETCRILSHNEIATGIFDLYVESSLAASARPGQFAGLYVPSGDKMLPRPISVCDADAQNNSLRFVYRVTQEVVEGTTVHGTTVHGTAEIARLKAGDCIDILGLLGNGYDLNAARGKQAVLLGGGIGVPPMLYLAKKLAESRASLHCNNVSALDTESAPIMMIMGYRNAETFLTDEFRQYGTLLIATDDGSVGTHGTVIDALKEVKGTDLLTNCGRSAVHLEAEKMIRTDEVYFACGPKPMLKALKEYTLETNTHGKKNISPRVYISLEERMACGVGVCLGCVTKTVRKDAHSGVHNARICTDGPVFDASEVEL